MKTNLLTTLRFIMTFLRLKLLNLRGKRPPLTGGVLDEQIALMYKGQELLGEPPLDQQTPPLHARISARRSGCSSWWG